MNKKIVYTLTALHIFAAQAAMPHPKIIIHTDINKTIIAEDPAGQKTLDDVLMHALAERYTDTWSPELDSPISYATYVKKYVLPGEKGDMALKKIRNKKIASFINFLQETRHPLYEQVHNHYTQLLTKLRNSKSPIFSSFFCMITHLEERNIPFSIVLRTFGTDLEQVIHEINTHLGKIFFSWRGTFANGILTVHSLTDSQTLTLHTSAQIYEFLATHGNVALQDDWRTWHAHGETQEYGKLFPINRQDKQITTLFLDDNGAPEDGILNPRHPHTDAALCTTELIASNHVCVVDMLHAIEDDMYYIQCVENVLRQCATQEE